MRTELFVRFFPALTGLLGLRRTLGLLEAAERLAAGLGLRPPVRLARLRAR